MKAFGSDLNSLGSAGINWFEFRSKHGSSCW